MAATTSSDSESVLDFDTDDLNAPFTSETERTLSATELATRLRFSASLQSIVDNPEFLKSIEYHTINPIKRAVNPGITVPGIGSRPVATTGILETLKGLFRGTSAKQQQQQSQAQSRYDGDVVPLPLNEATGKDLAGMMKPMVKEDPASWYLEADEFSLHEFADWKEQLEEVKKEACEKLGLLRHQVVDLVKAVPRYLMLHIGEGEGDEHTLWNDTFASKNSGNGTFAILRFILPSTRTDGEEEWIVGDDSAAENSGDGEDSQFSVYYAAHFSDVSYHTKDLLGVRLELVYLLQYNENFEDTMPLTPTVQQRIIDTMNGWDNRIPWSACTLMHRPQEPQEQAVEIGTLGPADLRKLRLLYRLSKKWRYQCFVANVTITKKKPIAEDGVSTTEVSLGRLSNLEGVLLEPPASISTDLLVPISRVDDLELKDRTRERADRTYRYYQYCRVMTFLWPTKFHGRHVEPLAAGDAFLKDWLIERRLNFVDGSKISFADKVDKAEFSSIALSLCQRGSDMKPFCLDAALRIKDPVLYEAALPGTRTVDLIKRGVDSLGFKAMSPIISRTLDLGVPEDLDAWCRYLLHLYNNDDETAFHLLRKLVTRMTKIQYLSNLDPTLPNPIITTLKFFYTHHLPSISEVLIRGLPHSYHQFWIPFIPHLQTLVQALKPLHIPSGNANLWVDRALTNIASQHPLPTADTFNTQHPTLTINPSRHLLYNPPTIRILAICSTHGRLDLVRVIFRRILRAVPTPESLLQSPSEIRDTNLRFLKALTISAYNTLVSTDSTLAVDPHGIFFAKVLAKYLLPNLGLRPERPPFPDMPCECDACTQVQNFLVLNSGNSVAVAGSSVTRSASSSGTGPRNRSLAIPVSNPQKLHHIIDHLPTRSDLAVSRIPYSPSSSSIPSPTSFPTTPTTTTAAAAAAAAPSSSTLPSSALVRQTQKPTHTLLLRILPTPAMDRWQNEQTWISSFMSFIRPKKIVREAMGGLWEDAVEAVQPGGEGWAGGVMEVDVDEDEGERSEGRRDSWGCHAARRKRRWSGWVRDLEMEEESGEEESGEEEEEEEEEEKGRGRRRRRVEVREGDVGVRSPRDGKRRKRVRTR